MFKKTRFYVLRFRNRYGSYRCRSLPCLPPSATGGDFIMVLISPSLIWGAIVAGGGVRRTLIGGREPMQLTTLLTRQQGIPYLSCSCLFHNRSPRAFKDGHPLRALQRPIYWEDDTLSFLMNRGLSGQFFDPSHIIAILCRYVFKMVDKDQNFDRW